MDAVGLLREGAGEDGALLPLLNIGVGSEPGARSIPSLAFGGWLDRSMVTMLLVFSDRDVCRKDDIFLIWIQFEFPSVSNYLAGSLLQLAEETTA